MTCHLYLLSCPSALCHMSILRNSYVATLNLGLDRFTVGGGDRAGLVTGIPCPEIGVVMGGGSSNGFPRPSGAAFSLETSLSKIPI